MTPKDAVIVAVAIAVGVAGYLYMGEPGRSDYPMSVRQSEIAGKDPAEMSPAETLARLQHLTQTQPDDPEPHYFIGQYLRARGRDTDAIRAFESALRRDGRFVPAMVGMADTFVALSDGEIGPEAARLYAGAWQLDSNQLRAGFLAGLALWQAGDRQAAESTWAGVRSALAGREQAAEFDRWVAAAKSADTADD